MTDLQLGAFGGHIECFLPFFNILIAINGCRLQRAILLKVPAAPSGIMYDTVDAGLMNKDT